MKKLTVLLVMVVLFLSGMVNLDEEEDYPWQKHAPPFDFEFGNMIDNHQQSRELPEKKMLQGFIYIRDTGDYTEEGYPIAERANCDTNPDQCRVGWIVKGVPITATLQQKGPRIWLVEPDSLPREGGYSHFQWVGNPPSPHALEPGDVKTGYLLKRIAPAPFYWLGGQGGGGGGGGHDGGGCGDEDSCDGHDGSDDSCDGHDGTDDSCDGHDDGSDDSCDGHDDGSDDSCDGHDGGSDGGCGGSGGQGGSTGHGGRLVPEGVDPHSNIVTSDDPGGGHGGGGGCCDDEGGCTGEHDEGS